jgi:hypothetical protein
MCDLSGKLEKLFPALTNRGDEEMIDNIYKAIKINIGTKD